MKENLICLPSGMIISLTNVAFMKWVADKLEVTFVGTPRVVLQQRDTEALLDALEAQRIDVAALRKTTGINKRELQSRKSMPQE